MAIRYRYLITVLVILTVFGFAYFRPIQLPKALPQQSRPDFQFKRVTIESYTDDRLDLMLDAEGAVLDRDSGQVKLTSVSGNAEPLGGVLVIRAPVAAYDWSTQTLDVKNGTFQFLDDGLMSRLEAANLRWDLAANRITGTNGVRLVSRQLIAKGPSVELDMNRGRLKLLGRSRIEVKQ